MRNFATPLHARSVRCSSRAGCSASGRWASAWPCNSGSATLPAARRAASTSAWSAPLRRRPRWCSLRSWRGTRTSSAAAASWWPGRSSASLRYSWSRSACAPPQLGGARLLEGLGAAAFVPVALGTVAAATSGDRRRRAGASGAFEASTLIGYAGGFGLGSVAYFGLHRGAFVLLAGLYALAAIVCLVFVPRVPPLPVHSLRVVLRAAIGPGPMRAFLPSWIMSFALIGAFVANLPSLLRHTRWRRSR